MYIWVLRFHCSYVYLHSTLLAPCVASIENYCISAKISTFTVYVYFPDEYLQLLFSNPAFYNYSTAIHGGDGSYNGKVSYYMPDEIIVGKLIIPINGSAKTFCYMSYDKEWVNIWSIIFLPVFLDNANHDGITYLLFR